MRLRFENYRVAIKIFSIVNFLLRKTRCSRKFMWVDGYYADPITGKNKIVDSYFLILIRF